MMLAASWLVLQLIAIIPQPSIAEENAKKTESRRHFKAGLALVEMEKFEGGAIEFEASIDLYPTHSALFNLANCYKAIHRYNEAIATFSEILKQYDKVITPKTRKAVERHKQELLSIVAELDIEITPFGATIRVDGRMIGNSPIEEALLVDPGTRQIQVSLEGYETEHLNITLLAKEARSLTFALRPTRAELLVSSNVDGATVFVDNQEMGTTPLSEPLVLKPGEHQVMLDKSGYMAQEKEITLVAKKPQSLELILVPTATNVKPLGKLSPWSWLGTGLTIVTAATGGTFLYLAQQSHQDFNRTKSKIEDPNAFWTNEEQAQLLSDQQSASDEVRRYSALGLGFGASAGAFLVTTVLFISHDLSKKNNKKETVSFTPGKVAVNF